MSAFIREAGFDVKAVKATHTVEPYGGITAAGVRMAANEQKNGALYESEFKAMLKLFEGGIFKKADKHSDGNQEIELNFLRADIEQGARSGKYEYAGWHFQLVGTIEQLEELATRVTIPELPSFVSVRSRSQPGTGSAHGESLAKENQPTSPVESQDDNEPVEVEDLSLAPPETSLNIEQLFNEPTKENSAHFIAALQFNGYNDISPVLNAEGRWIVSGNGKRMWVIGWWFSRMQKAGIAKEGLPTKTVQKVLTQVIGRDISLRTFQQSNGISKDAMLVKGRLISYLESNFLKKT